MGIRFYCPNGHKLNVKAFQAGRRGICPYCGVSMMIPTESTISPNKSTSGQGGPPGGPSTVQPTSQPFGASTASAMAHPATQPVSSSPAAATSSVAPTPVELSRSPAPAEPLAAAPTGAASRGAVSSPMTGVPPDPLTEAPTAVWYVRPAAGGQYGPATCEIMRTWLNEGRVGADSLVWREGWHDWQEAHQVFPQLKHVPLIPSLGGKPGPTTPLPTFARPSGMPTTMIIAGLALTIVFLVIVFLLVLFRQPSAQHEPTTPPTSKAAVAVPLTPRELT